MRSGAEGHILNFQFSILNFLQEQSPTTFPLQKIEN